MAVFNRDPLSTTTWSRLRRGLNEDMDMVMELARRNNVLPRVTFVPWGSAKKKTHPSHLPNPQVAPSIPITIRSPPKAASSSSFSPPAHLLVRHPFKLQSSQHEHGRSPRSRTLLSTQYTSSSSTHLGLLPCGARPRTARCRRGGPHQKSGKRGSFSASGVRLVFQEKPSGPDSVELESRCL